MAKDYFNAFNTAGLKNNKISLDFLIFCNFFSDIFALKTLDQIHMSDEAIWIV